MSFVVIDLEWNQAMSSKSQVFNRLPIHLSGEIIEIGAVKLNSDFSVGEEFTIDVKPVYFKQMHYQVKKITGFDKERLAKGVSFKEAFQQLRSWCGEDVTFLTWGCDDQRVMEQNIIIHDLDWDWIRDWVNLQMIYNIQTGGDKNQKSLASAMEFFGIEQTRIAHDALGDAYNTALVTTFLDMPEGLRLYPDAAKILAARMPNAKPAAEPQGPEPIAQKFIDGFRSKAEALASEELNDVKCPVCGGSTSYLKWINQGDQRYMNIYSCEEDGDYLVRARFHKIDDLSWSVNRIVYEADAETRTAYKTKAAQARRRGRTHANKKGRPAK